PEGTSLRLVSGPPPRRVRRQRMLRVRRVRRKGYAVGLQLLSLCVCLPASLSVAPSADSPHCLVLWCSCLRAGDLCGNFDVCPDCLWTVPNGFSGITAFWAAVLSEAGVDCKRAEADGAYLGFVVGAAVSWLTANKVAFTPTHRTDGSPALPSE